jgi:hypothetical protein
MEWLLAAFQRPDWQNCFIKWGLPGRVLGILIDPFRTQRKTQPGIIQNDALWGRSAWRLGDRPPPITLRQKHGEEEDYVESDHPALS